MTNSDVIHCEKCGNVMQEVENPSLVGNFLKRKFQCQYCNHVSYKDTGAGLATTLLAVASGTFAVIKGLGLDKSNNSDQA